MKNMARMLAKKAIPRTKFCFGPIHPCAVRVAMMSRLNKALTPGCRKRSGYARRARARGAASDEKWWRGSGRMHVCGILCERRAARTTSHLFLHDVLETTDSLVHVIMIIPPWLPRAAVVTGNWPSLSLFAVFVMVPTLTLPEHANNSSLPSVTSEIKSSRSHHTPASVPPVHTVPGIHRPQHLFGLQRLGPPPSKIP